ncbi:MAG TPA: BspA family leucine-rich repeat surface protein [Flavobacterium sp.]|jgi:surface protein
MKLKILIISCTLLYSLVGFGQFITTWNTGATNKITVPTTGTGYNYTATIALLETPQTIITTLTNVSGNAVFSDLAMNTSYQVKITGNFPRIYINNGGERFKLKAVTQWDNIAWTSFNKAFFGCTGLNVTASDVPILSGVTDTSQMFQYCSTLNGPANINSWNMSTITDVSNMFVGATIFNQNIGNWNTGAVTNMSGIFANTVAFNQDIGSWNTASVTNMSSVFAGAKAFNQNIGNWNTASGTTMEYMFQGATAFNQSLNNWNTALVANMGNMFYGATIFNGEIGSWNTESVTNMESMFRDATSFNKNIGNWETSAVTNISSMFYKATNFNQDIGNWNTSAVIAIGHTFNLATSFNQDIGNWDTSAVFNMQFAFQQASAFNQDLSNWDVSNVLYMGSMFKQASSFNQSLASWASQLNPGVELSGFGGFIENCGMSVANYDATLVALSSDGPNGINLGALGLYYCNAGAVARANLILAVASGGKGWFISGDTSLVNTSPLLATSGNTVTLTYMNCNHDWSNPTNRARKMLMINENGNDISPSAVIINHNNIGNMPVGVTSTDGYYQISNSTQSTRISNRLVSIADAGNYTENDGVIVRVYYSVPEYTNIVINAPPVGEIVDAGWFLSDIGNAAGVVGNMSAGIEALPSAEKIIPISSGSENGIAFAEFKLMKLGTIGLYAKTQQGSLGPELSISDLEKSNKFLIYPNPVNMVLNMELPDYPNFKTQNITITNMLGQIMYSNWREGNSVDVSFLQSGLYQVSLETDYGNWNGKFIKN